jgi:hypothetical protein
MSQQNLGSFDYGDNPLFTATFQQNGVNTSPASVVIKVTNPLGVQSTPAATAGAAGVYTFQIAGGLMVPEGGLWTGRAYAPPGTGQASIDFEFYQNGSPNP